MVVNGNNLFEACPIKNMETKKIYAHGVSHGRSEAGYDIRIKQKIQFLCCGPKRMRSVRVYDPTTDVSVLGDGHFTIASAIEEFQMPNHLLGIVHDKSSWARKGLSVFNTVIEPGWEGFLTLELVYHGQDELIIPAGAGIAQVVFSQVSDPVAYTGRYQHQANRPVEAIASKSA